VVEEPLPPLVPEVARAPLEPAVVVVLGVVAGAVVPPLPSAAGACEPGSWLEQASIHKMIGVETSL
jgi:hypothetical protein